MLAGLCLVTLGSVLGGTHVMLLSAELGSPLSAQGQLTVRNLSQLLLNLLLFGVSLCILQLSSQLLALGIVALNKLNQNKVLLQLFSHHLTGELLYGRYTADSHLGDMVPAGILRNQRQDCLTDFGVCCSHVAQAGVESTALALAFANVAHLEHHLGCQHGIIDVAALKQSHNLLRGLIAQVACGIRKINQSIAGRSVCYCAVLGQNLVVVTMVHGILDCVKKVCHISFPPIVVRFFVNVYRFT